MPPKIRGLAYIGQNDGGKDKSACADLNRANVEVAKICK